MLNARVSHPIPHNMLNARVSHPIPHNMLCVLIVMLMCIDDSGILLLFQQSSGDRLSKTPPPDPSRLSRQVRLRRTEVSWYSLCYLSCWLLKLAIMYWDWKQNVYTKVYHTATTVNLPLTVHVCIAVKFVICGDPDYRVRCIMHAQWAVHFCSQQFHARTCGEGGGTRLLRTSWEGLSAIFFQMYSIVQTDKELYNCTKGCTENETFIFRSVLGAESNGEGPKCMW